MAAENRPALADAKCIPFPVWTVLFAATLVVRRNQDLKPGDLVAIPDAVTISTHGSFAKSDREVNYIVASFEDEPF